METVGYVEKCQLKHIGTNPVWINISPSLTDLRQGLKIPWLSFCDLVGLYFSVIFEIRHCHKIYFSQWNVGGSGKIRHKFYGPTCDFIYFCHLAMVIMEYWEYFFINLDLRVTMMSRSYLVICIEHVALERNTLCHVKTIEIFSVVCCGLQPRSASLFCSVINIHCIYTSMHHVPCFTLRIKTKRNNKNSNNQVTPNEVSFSIVKRGSQQCLKLRCVTTCWSKRKSQDPNFRALFLTPRPAFLVWMYFVGDPWWPTK